MKAIRKINKKLIILTTIILLIGIPILINMTFFKPTKFNSFIAASIYNAPANSAFTDDNFYQCVVDTYNYTNGTSVTYTTKLTDEQLKTIKELECGNVNNVTGIEKMINIEFLYLLGNFKEINLEKNINIKELGLHSLILEKIENINYLNNLRILGISSQKYNYSQLDFSRLLNLEEFYIEHYPDNNNNNNNNKYEIDLKQNKKLKVLVFCDMNYVNVDLSQNVNLEELDLASSYVPNLNLEKFTKLKKLWIVNSDYTSIDISKNTELEVLEVSENKISNIDLSNNTKLYALGLAANQLNSLDVSKNLELKYLIAENNNISSLDLSNNKKLKYINLFDNPFTKNLVIYKGGSIDFYNDKGLINFYDYSNTVQYIKSSLMTKTGSFSSDGSYEGNLIYRWYDSSNGDYLIESDSDNTIIDGSNITFNDSGKFKVSAKYASKYFVSASKSRLYYSSRGNDSYTYSGNYTVDVITANSDVYTINNTEEWIYIGTDNNINTIKNNIVVPEGIDLDIDLNTNKIKVLNGNEVLKEFAIIDFTVNNFKSDNKLISIPEEVTYQNFISNITTNGVTYKIYKDNTEVKNGNITKEMILKIYKDSELIDTYEITDEFLEFDNTLNVNENNKTINKQKERQTVTDILSKINTSGTVTVKNNKGKELADKDLVGTESKVIVELNNETIEYTIIVSGDITGDGIVNIADVVKLADHTLKENVLNEYEQIAAEVTKNDKLNIADVAKIADYTLNKSIEIWR